jgi:PAS domain S-box-containing protein
MKWHQDPEDNRGGDVGYFQQLADGAPVMIWMSGRDTGCFYFNPAWLDYRGRTLEEEFGNGWAEGVHPDDLEVCLQHYISSFEDRTAFAMSYRLQHHSGEFRWILDRGVPHYGVAGEFLGFYGGCAETPAASAGSRIKELREAIDQMRGFAGRVAAAEAVALGSSAKVAGPNSHRHYLEHRARHRAATELDRLGADMRAFEGIANGALLR